jgi:hypothetical protein
VTPGEYQRICDRLARKAIRFANEMAEVKDPDNVTDEHEHWIDVFFSEHLPDIDADALLEVTSRADAWDKAGGYKGAVKDVRARAAFEADVWDSINKLEDA